MGGFWGGDIGCGGLYRASVDVLSGILVWYRVCWCVIGSVGVDGVCRCDIGSVGVIGGGGLSRGRWCVTGCCVIGLADVLFRAIGSVGVLSGERWCVYRICLCRVIGCAGVLSDMPLCYRALCVIGGVGVLSGLLCRVIGRAAAVINDGCPRGGRGWTLRRSGAKARHQIFSSASLPHSPL